MVAAYRGGTVEALIAKRVVKLSSVILANLVIGENVVPEFLQENCTPEKLMPALRDVLANTPLRSRQVEAFAQLDEIMSTGNETPSARAAEVVLAQLRKPRS